MADSTRTSGYFSPQPWWYANDTPILSVFLMMTSKDTAKWKSAGWTRYATYCKAKTIGEAFELGATRADIKYQVERGNMTLEPPTAAARKKQAAELEKRAAGEPGWLEKRAALVDAGKPLKELKGSPEDCLARGHIVEQLRDVHADAGLRGLRRATPAMPCFTLVNAAGDTIHSTSHEGHEQLVATWCLRSDDCVLEIGGGVGAVSTMVQKILRKKSDHVVVEPQAHMCDTLERNKALHKSGYHVARGALAKGAVFSCATAALDGPDSCNQRQWMFNMTSSSKNARSVRVASLDPTQLRSKVSKPFTALVVDCEGAFPAIVEDFPDLLDGVRAVYLERDGPPKTDYAAADAALERAGLALALAASKHRVYVKATAEELAKRDVKKAKRLAAKCDTKTAASYRSERAAKKGKAKPAPKKRKRAGAAPPPGTRVEVLFDDGVRYPGAIAELLGANKARIAYDDGDEEYTTFPDDTVTVIAPPPPPDDADDSGDDEVTRPTLKTSRQLEMEAKTQKN